MAFYGINLIVQGGANNRTIYNPVIRPGANNRIIYRETIFYFTTIFYWFGWGRIPGKRVFLGGYNLPENGAWQVLGVAKCLKMDFYGINLIVQGGANNRTIYYPVIRPGANNRIIYRETIFYFTTIFYWFCWGKNPREEGFLGGIQSTRKRGMASVGVAKCLKMDFYGINLIVQGGANNRTIYNPVIRPGANNRIIYRETIFYFTTIFYWFGWGKNPREEGFLGGIQSTRKRGMASFGVAKCLKMDFYGINLIVQGGANNRIIYRETIFYFTTIFYWFCWGKNPREEGFLGGRQSTRKRGMASFGGSQVS